MIVLVILKHLLFAKSTLFERESTSNEIFDIIVRLVQHLTFL